ncbi:hypothetical protein [Roseiterribacter gracilis]|uniref:Uncharacterized protein n=1 Tax=Roseiterribacter gracilis TaxID=2812848 RepID=A0A8S8X9Z6_9PROT|nr:hypothetical protein TMPK1_03820 [Rhodospirillales bacterium TMPK1]
MLKGLALAFAGVLLLTGCASKPADPNWTESAKKVFASGNPVAAYDYAAKDLNGARRAQAIAFLQENGTTIGPAIKEALFKRAREDSRGASGVNEDMRAATAAGLISDADATDLIKIATAADDKRRAEKAVADALRAKRLAALKPLRLHLVSEPDNRLIVDDVKRQLSDLQGAVVFIDAPEKGALTVKVKQLRWAERQQSERMRTLTVGYYESDPLFAALLLPKGASTMIDVREGGVELEYAFEVSASENGNQIGSELVRDTLTQNFYQCSGMRVQNVFGGISPSNGFPNQASQSFCSGGSTPTDLKALGTRAYVATAIAIKRLGPVQIALKRYQEASA